MDPTWTTLAILLTGVAIVVGGILLLRLHAFLALVLGALVVGGLTSESLLLQNNALPVVSQEATSGELVVKAHNVKPGQQFRIYRPGQPGTYAALSEATALTESTNGQVRVRLPSGVEDQPGDLVLTQRAAQEAAEVATQTLGERVARAFGRTCGSIGILIAMASIIGKCLLDSGAADRIVRSALRTFGEGAAGVAFLLSSFLLGIPVFFDTVFYLMIPLAKAMRMRTGRNYLLYIFSIVAGGTMAHSLVPPTPGPLFVAEALGVNMGVMILAGSIVGLFTASTGYIYAAIRNWNNEIPLRETAELSLADLEAIARRDERSLPPLWLAVLPILLPVVLITGQTVVELVPLQNVAIPGLRPEQSRTLIDVGLRIMEQVGDKQMALVLSAAIAMLLLVRRRHESWRELMNSMQEALASAGMIILITSAGGAFGAMLQQTGVAGLIRDLPNASPPMILLLAFLITAAIRTAQGSATVAMVTAVGVLSGLASSGQLGFHPVYLALAIGCGSKPVSWMNDSGFWVICKMSGMTDAETLRFNAPLTALMGVAGLIVLMIAVVVLPLA